VLRALEVSSRATAKLAALAAGGALAAEQAQQRSIGVAPASAEALQRFSAPLRE